VIRTLIGLLLVALASPALAFDPWSDPAHYEFEYEVDLSKVEAGPGEKVELWIPLATSSPHQRLLGSSIDAPFPVRETTDRLGNRMAHLSWVGPAPEEARLLATVLVERKPDRGTPTAEVAPGSRDDATLYLGARKKIPLGGLIEQLAVQESRGLDDDGEKIRAFYDYVVKTMRYSKEGEGWGQGDAVWACTSKYGNCTDFHSLFLGMARSQGIPARFVIGFPITPVETSGAVGGYHCWAEAWQADRGWVPFDASEAWKAKRFDDYFGTLPSDRIAFTIGRDLVLEPPQRGEPLNYFVYPYAEVAGETVSEVKASFRFRRVDAEQARR
jgi:transglutaminase-like putative cysteine protease